MQVLSLPLLAVWQASPPVTALSPQQHFLTPPVSLLIQIKMEMTTPVLSTVAPGGGNQATNIQFVMESRWVMGKKGPWQRGEEVIGEPDPSGGKGMLVRGAAGPNVWRRGSDGIDSILAQRQVSCPPHLFKRELPHSP